MIEILVALVISFLALGALYESYLAILRAKKQQEKIAETNFQVLMALEFLRKDIELAGFGMPRDISISNLTYEEAISSSTCSPDYFNSSTNSTPKPIDLGGNYCNNSDYLVIRSSAANLDKNTSRKWAYTYYDGSGWRITSLGTLDFSTNDRCVALDHQKSLINWNFSCNNFSGSNISEIYYLFGINDSPLRMPFNRVDYFLKKPSSLPYRCYQATYELYRGEIQHSNGDVNEQPILDCVLSFQVIVGRDTNNDNIIDAWSKDLSSLSATQVFEEVKEIDIYIIYQEGQRERKEVFDSDIIRINYPDGTYDDINIPSKNYRWKLIEIKVKPFNLEDIKL
ncbi:Type IV fimbrial biogenesis protein PilW [Thermosulfurimonas dismutans]|uniref:Type IV fimbrial biogenesis protein PilW n=1 Tax=Thermosulfurimonas dismutans TaxID=999894 RepID=A0A179D537_9BACT|nr:Type IV fimbrial biogenesis protein PilW [Thermosulfurimonas dismutans]